jgi:2-amino-4-hydroxy-6-hydroxymethyldihydropteridine diphosphokinase
MIHCYLGLGSNLRSPERQLRRALTQLQKLPRSVVTDSSNLYLSKPCGLRSQPRYFNMVVAINTSLPAEQLLRHCQRIENNHLRVRKTHWGARTLDIDLLLYGDKVIHQADLNVPHPQMIHRDFVLVPLLEICPTAQLPTGEPLVSYLKACETYLLARR